MTTEQLEQVMDCIMEKTKKDAYALVICEEKEPGLFDSKFGGVPYWDGRQEYPKDSEGNFLLFLAQVNFSQAEPLEGLPSGGMLQFFIGCNDVFGADFDCPDKQDTFRVIYHSTLDEHVTKEQVLALGIPLNTEKEYEEFTPVWGEYLVEVQKTCAYMGESDYRFEGVFREAVQEVTGEELGDSRLYDILTEEQYNQLFEELDCTQHWMLGYPYFTQYDPREYEEGLRRYDTLLFQMDSEGFDGGDYVLWGDCGVANFFINWEDLQKLDFSKVLYTWDCC